MKLLLQLLLLGIPIYLFVTFMSTRYSAAPTVSAEKVEITESPKPKIPQLPTSEEVWREVNDWREESGRKRYIESKQLCDIADIRVEEIPKGYSHDGFIKFQNYPEVIAENLAGIRDDGDIVEQWLRSKPHRNTLEQEYVYSCVRCKYNACIQIFGN